jgi:hypothetical protein
VEGTLACRFVCLEGSVRSIAEDNAPRLIREAFGSLNRMTRPQSEERKTTWIFFSTVAAFRRNSSAPHLMPQALTC